jgi:hypothetical protein
MAIVIVGLALLPILQTFSQSYVLATKQHEQQAALKIAEAVLNKAMGVRFAELNGPATAQNIPLDIQTQEGTLSGILEMAGNPAFGSGSVRLGRMTYGIQLETARQFTGTPYNPGTNPNMLTYHFHDGAPETYYCPDDVLRLFVRVRFGNPAAEVTLTTYRTDLHR